MSLQMIRIYGYTDEEFLDAVDSSEDVNNTPFYEAMLNPESLNWKRSVNYNEDQPANTTNPSATYKNTPSETLQFDIVIDCTGVVNSARTNMANEISSLETISYTYDGTIHRPNFVKIMWGQGVLFKGMLTSFDTNYTLFDPNGNPLRAKVSLSFSEYVSPSDEAAEKKASSPDLTHLIMVQDGMPLPRLCKKVWNNSFYFIQVAKYNGLNKFRNLKGGSSLIFPPIIQQNNGK